MLSQLLTTGINTDKDQPALTDEAVAARIKPVGQVEVTDPNAPKVEKSGKEVVDAVCSACHATGALNAPKIGDKAAWSTHIGGGLEHLTQNAIKGVRQMPPRGGNPDLTDIEIARAIVVHGQSVGREFQGTRGQSSAGQSRMPKARRSKAARSRNKAQTSLRLFCPRV